MKRHGCWLAMFSVLFWFLSDGALAQANVKTSITTRKVNGKTVPTVARVLTGTVTGQGGLEKYITNGGFDQGLTGWKVEEKGGTTAPGKVFVDQGEAVLLEGDSFLVSLQQSFVIEGHTFLSLDLRQVPGFDRTSGFIPDAFEVHLLDKFLKSVVPTWDPLASSFFNLQEDQTVNKGAATQWDGRTILVDVSAVPPGTEVTLYIDLIGADRDTGSGMRVDNAFLGGLAQAGPNAHQPGSCLVFPIVDSRAGQGKGTIISVTNTNGSRAPGTNPNLRFGDVCLHYYYVADNGTVSNVGNVLLTPNDTLTVFAGDHARNLQQGYLYVVAEDPESGRLINFNYLVGSEIVVDVAQNRLWAVPAFAFKCRVEQGDRDSNGRYFADANRNGSFDFDGVEYDMWPDELFVSSFPTQRMDLESELILVSGLGSDYRTYFDLDFYNNEEVFLSFHNEYFFNWMDRKLLDITAAFGRLQGTAREPDTGWMRINGTWGIHVLTGQRWYRDEIQGGVEDAPIIGAYAERVKKTAFQLGRLLHHRGAQNGNEFPWRDNS